MNHRPLKTIAAEIATALKREVKDVIEIGGLLAEAKEQLDAHGHWLPWVKEHFPRSIRSAQNYMTAHAFAAKYATVAHLRLAVGGLYALAEADRAGNSEAVEAALAEARDKWVDEDRVRAIIAELAAPKAGDEAELPPSQEGGAGDDADEQDDDQPFPEPPPSPTPRQAAQLQQFEGAAKALLSLKAKPAQEFLAAAISGFDLETIANLLQRVALEKLKVASADWGSGDGAQRVKTG
jgi:hypothetical protein